MTLSHKKVKRTQEDIDKHKDVEPEIPQLDRIEALVEALVEASKK